MPNAPHGVQSDKISPSIELEMEEEESMQIEHPPVLIFLDIDGVLNVGIRDPGSSPLCFNEANFSIARKLAKGSAKSDTAEMLLAVMRMTTGDGNESAYGDFLSRNDLDVCDVFVHRFVKIIRAAGNARRVIISSSWRRPKYMANVQNLEKIISTYLGEPFTFDDRTELVDEVDRPDRLRLIGDYISKNCNKGLQTCTEINALVLDDFFYMPMKGFKVGSTMVESKEQAEMYLQKRAPDNIDVKVRIVHTYHSQVLPSGFEVHVGTGLSLQHVQDAVAFLIPGEEVKPVSPRPTNILSTPLLCDLDDDEFAYAIPKDLSVDTWIFLDIDGVLNVGIKEPGSSGLSFSEANFSVARKLMTCDTKSDVAEMLLSVMRMYTCDGNSSTYGDFFSRNDLDVCDIFVHRFVKILRAAGDKRRVIISSSWRKPRYEGNIKKLEKIISVYLGETFMFDDRTALVDEEGGHDRLRLIGDYIKVQLRQEVAPERLHVLVLDDFFYMPVKGFQCDGTKVDSLASAESYLEACPPSKIFTKAKVVHTYISNVLQSGLEVQVGTGLSLQHLSDALTFLGAMRRQTTGLAGQHADPEPLKKAEDQKAKWCCSLM